DRAHLQVFEDTRGVRVGMPVELTGELLSVTLGPGMLGSIYDGLQKPLERLEDRQGFFLRRGATAPAVDEQRTWPFTPTAKVGDRVQAGDWLGWVQEHGIQHHTLAPLTLRGPATVTHVAARGPVQASDVVARLRDRDGGEVEVSLVQRWPVKRAIAAYPERLYPRQRLATGCRVIDTLFPIARGGTACVPGPFGAGKTVLQQLLARYAAVDIVIVVACGERAGEVVETIDELPKLRDPKTGGSLMDRTIIICNTSSMPVASREASIYTGITLAEYYRQLGLDVLVLADSTSRWAQAMRELSGRLEEIPGEEAFPAYLDSRIAGLYERAGLVRLHSGQTGAVTLIGTVSPAGGNFEEPVTQATLKVVGAFHGLSRARSDERKFPAIDPLDSWSRYAERLEQDQPEWTTAVAHARQRLARAAAVGRMMAVVGEEGITLEDLVAYLAGELLDTAYLQQNAFDAVDAFTPMPRQRADLARLHRVLTTPLHLPDKAAARALFGALTDAFYQRAYCQPEDDAFVEQDQRIDTLLAEATDTTTLEGAA
ncbi:MAG: V-type ATP synthase subunit A, partial [Deltaproteobacteria bacterium]|nr:V-type ATP synthase subunit A [Deltaproteobacteria bacterium]